MESKLNIDLTEMLDWCAVRSNETYMRIQEVQKKEDERILLVNSLIKIRLMKAGRTNRRAGSENCFYFKNQKQRLTFMN